MVPQTQQRKKRNSTKVNLFLSAAFHGIIVGTLLYFAARQGLLGRQIKKIAVEMVKEKKEEKPKEPEKPKEEPPRVDIPKVVQAPKIEEPKALAQAPPPSMAVAPPAVAPPAVDVPSFDFNGGKLVISSSDPVQLYKSQLETALRSHWDRPEDLDDHGYVAEVEVSVDHSGQINNPVWKKESGNHRWDDSVHRAVAGAKGVDRPPPAQFPSRVVVRFDVVQAEPVVQ